MSTSTESASPMRKRRRVWPWALGASLAICLALGLGAYGFVRHLNSSPGKVGLYRLEITQGMTARQIGEMLEREGLIRSATFFRTAARLKDFDRHIHAGWHWVDGSQTTLAILRQLLSGGLQIVKVTVPEGLTVEQIAEIIAEYLPVSPDSFLTVTRDPEMVARYAFPGARTLEGFLFPDTYYFDANADAREVVRVMTGRFHELFTPRMIARAESLGMTPFQIVTLASIIEKEAMVDSERAIISQVFHKRLKLGYKLGADPTVKYALRRNHRRLSLRDIEIDSPYNTYRYPGLPPGPICNPGIASIRAALWPADTDYLYFVANWDGTHIFSRTLREHNAAKRTSERRYRQWRAERRRRELP